MRASRKEGKVEDDKVRPRANWEVGKGRHRGSTLWGAKTWREASSGLVPPRPLSAGYMA